MQEARELIASAEKQRLLSVFITAAGTATISNRQVIEQGTLGAVKHFESHFDRFARKSASAGASNVPGSGFVVRPGAAPDRPGAAAIWFAAVGAR